MSGRAVSSSGQGVVLEPRRDPTRDRAEDMEEYLQVMRSRGKLGERLDDHMERVTASVEDWASSPAMRQYLRRLPPDLDPRDELQNLWLALLHIGSRARVERAYIQRAITNGMRSHFRSARVNRRVALSSRVDDLGRHEPLADPRAEEREGHEILELLDQFMRPDSKALLLDIVLRGRTERELAAERGTNARTIRRWFHEQREFLRQQTRVRALAAAHP